MMKNYKITINVSEVGGVYSAKNMEEAKKNRTGRM